MTLRQITIGILTAAALAACSKERGSEGGEGARTEREEHREGEGRREEHGGGGDTVVVEMYSDGNGNYFKPANIEVHRGDVIRWTLKSGVHNVHFLPDSNAGKQNLPAASDMLQLPDQTWDLKVDLAEGRYYYQCDPHALLGMIGHVKVEDED